MVFGMPNMFIMGPMGMSMSFGGCGCGVNMPFYGMDDPLPFLNFPVFRYTGMDYLLDPRLAYYQSMQDMRNGFGPGNFGSNYLPLFNNFPMSQTCLSPWWNPSRKPETDEEKAKREAREEKEKSPEYKEKKEKVEQYKKLFEEFKKITDTDSDKFKDLKKDYDNALKEKDIDKKIEKLEEVFESIETSALRKAILASDKKNITKLYLAGYNFGSGNAVHKATESERDWKDTLILLNNGMESGNDEPVGAFAGMVNNNKTQILQILSTWNDTHNGAKDKGLLRKLAETLPKDTPGQQVQWKTAIVNLSNALVSKAEDFAKEYGGIDKFPNLQSMIKKVNEGLKPINETNTQTGKISKEQVNKLANEFDNLYAALRMLEATALNREFVDKYAEKMNEIREDVIPDDIILKETKEDLESEGMKDVISKITLDSIPEKKSDIKIRKKSDKEKMKKIDEDTKDDPQEKVNQLVSSGKLEQDEDHEGIYHVKLTGENVPTRSFKVVDDKLVEIDFSSPKKEPISEEDVTAAEINEYIETARDIEKYIKDGELKVRTNMKISSPKIYQATGADKNGFSDIFYIKDNKLVKIKGTLSVNGNVDLKSGGKKLITELTDDDVTVVTSADDIYSAKDAEAAEAAKKAKEGNNSVNDNSENKTQNNTNINFDEKLTSEKVSSYDNINGKVLRELDLEDTDVDGWYKKTIGKTTKYYKYNPETNSFELQNNVKTVNDDGTYVDNNNKLHLCKQADTPEYYARQLNKALWMYTTERDRKKSLRCLHTLLAYDDAEDIARFFNEYDKQTSFFEFALCKSLWNECGYENKVERDGKKYKYKDYLIQKIAEQLLVVADEVKVDSDTKDAIKTIAKGERYAWYRTNPGKLDSLISEVMEIYKEKHNIDDDDEKSE